MEEEVFKKLYWEYFIDIESQFLNLKRYVSFQEKNLKTFSNEILKLLQITCSEVDVLAKVIVSTNNKISKKCYIAEWGYYLQKDYDRFLRRTVCFDNDMNVFPFENTWKCEPKINNKGFKQGKGLFWWQVYNNVKHQRTSLIEGENVSSFVKANLEVLIYAFCALYILEDIVINNILIGVTKLYKSSICSFINN